MRYTIEITHTAKKFLSKLSKVNYELIIQAVYSIADNPYQDGVKKLKGQKNVFRKRAGNYRIIYTINGNLMIVSVINIGHRKDIYS